MSPHLIGLLYRELMIQLVRDIRSLDMSADIIFNIRLIHDSYGALCGPAASTSGGIAHTFRYAFATELLRSGSDIQAVQEILGHNDIRTTEISTDIIGDRRAGTVSPFDRCRTIEAVHQSSKLGRKTTQN